MIDPENVPLEEKLKVIKIYRQMLENMMREVIRPEHVDTMRRLQRVVSQTEALREAAARPKPKPQEELGKAIAQIRTPEEQAELEQVLAEARAYRGQGRRG